MLKFQDARRLNPNDNELADKERLAAEKYIKALKLEECFLKQKARVNQLNLGDDNNAFFHQSIEQKINKNNIIEEDGNQLDNEDAIRDEDEHYFKKILAPSSNPNNSNLQWQPDTVLIEDHTKSLLEEITDEEIKEVIWNGKEGKVPQPDGFTLCFFKAAWEVVGLDVAVAIKHFLNTGRLLKEVNSTFISLIPKKLEASTFNDYRPIALYNFMYKFITKILANRLKKVMNVLVQPNQTAFIEGRSIVENILLCMKWFDDSKGKIILRLL